MNFHKRNAQIHAIMLYFNIFHFFENNILNVIGGQVYISNACSHIYKIWEQQLSNIMQQSFIMIKV